MVISDILDRIEWIESSTIGKYLIILMVGLVLFLIGWLLNRPIAIISGSLIIISLIGWHEYVDTEDLLTPIFMIWGFFVYFYLVPYIWLVMGGDLKFEFNNSASIATYTYTLAFVGGMVASYGYYSSLGFRLMNYYRAYRPEQFTLSRKNIQKIGIFLVSLGIISAYVFIALNGGLNKLFISRKYSDFATQLNTWRYWLIFNFFTFAGFIIYTRTPIDRVESHKRLLIISLMAILLTSIMVLFGSRKRTIGIVLLWIIYYNYEVKRFTPLSVLALATAGIAALISFIPLNLLMRTGSVDIAIAHFYNKGLDIIIYSILFQTQMAIIEGINPGSWLLGATFLHIPFIEDFVTVIDRFAVNPKYVAEIQAYGSLKDNTQFVPGALGELYMNFGEIGIIVGGLLLGVVSRLIYAGSQQSNSMVFPWLYSWYLYALLAIGFESFLQPDIIGIFGILIVIPGSHTIFSWWKNRNY